jgi:sulfoxide reductase catalytic subunit YedY
MADDWEWGGATMGQEHDYGQTRVHSYLLRENGILKRRKFLSTAVTAAAGAFALAACGTDGSENPAGGASAGSGTSSATRAAATPMPAVALPEALAHSEPFSSAATDELGDPVNSFKQITNYNNYYEFSTDKEQPAQLAVNFEPLPWWVEVTGLVNKPRTFDIQELYTLFPQEERVYRLRCVEAWSMVIPWVGFPLARLLELVEPKPEATYVKFVSVMRPEQMPGQRIPMLAWPYVEGLRVDEAMNPLTLMATGMDGMPLTNQQGAPIRLVVPWKYGFKSVKAVTRIELTTEQPLNTWQQAAPSEYGFYANVNPTVSHPRWSQASERRIGEIGRRETLMFNGYEDEVSALYSDLDLRANY